MLKNVMTMLVALCLLAGLPVVVKAESAETITLSFSDSGITEVTAGSGYTTEGTTLTITAAGTYHITGSCSDGSIVVKKELTGVTLILDNLTLSASQTAPVVIKKGASVIIQTVGTSTLTDQEDPSAEPTTEEEEAVSDFEGAAIKVKSGATLTLKGEGTLNAEGASCKNGIKGAATATVKIVSGTVNVTAANNGIASDGSVMISGGTVNIESDGDGIKSEPDADDAESEGKVIITDGAITVNAQGDGIQAAKELNISGGVFDITTLSGYKSNNFNSDTMSCKGLKASTNEQEDVESYIIISGGIFNLNTADDAIHSDDYITITGGKFSIYTGDDGVHADTTLALGSEDGKDRDPDIAVYASYEGIEAGTIEFYSGKYYVIATDDGVNAAGGSNNGSDPGMGGGNTFNPGGGFGNRGGMGGPGGQNAPGGQNNPGNQNAPGMTAAGDYAIYVYGGTLYINADGDGLDSNGNLELYGGNIEVWGMHSGGDNEPLDYDGTLIVKGATVFGAGSSGMGTAKPANDSQNYISTTTSYGNGTLLNVTNGSNTVYQATATKNVNYVFYSSPDTTSSYKITTGNGAESCALGDGWSHNWDEGVITTAATEESEGMKTYTCSVCGATETETIPVLAVVNEEKEEKEENAEELLVTDAYVVTFDAGEHATINVYDTQDYTLISGEDVSTAYARNSSTGAYDISGEGQVNFTVIPEEGYYVTDVRVEGEYKNLKLPSETGKENTYRITKVAGNLTVTVILTTEEVQETYYTATFKTDEHATINVYYTQDYSAADESAVTQTLVRNSDTGLPDGSGNGQVNFTVVPDEGYTVSEVTVEGDYKNLKKAEDTGLENTYRITKVTSDLTVTITAIAMSEEDLSDSAKEDGTEDKTKDGTDVIKEDETGNTVEGGADAAEEGETGNTVENGADAAKEGETGSTVENGMGSIREGNINEIPDSIGAKPDNTDATMDSNGTTPDNTNATSENAGTKTGNTNATSDSNVIIPGNTNATSENAGTKTGDINVTSDSTGTTTGNTEGATDKNALSITAVEQTILSQTTDKDPSGSAFYLLQAKAKKVTKNSVKLSWKKVNGAVSYVIYGNKCGRNKKFRKLTEVKGTTYTQKKLTKGTYYKYIVVAVGSNGEVLSTSKVVHTATTGGNVGNTKSIKLSSKAKVTLKVGKSSTIKAKAVSSGLTVKKHRGLSYESSNTSVATVTAKGKIKAVGKGTCYVYVYAQNGVMKQVKVTVK